MSSYGATPAPGEAAAGSPAADDDDAGAEAALVAAALAAAAAPDARLRAETALMAALLQRRYAAHVAFFASVAVLVGVPCALVYAYLTEGWFARAMRDWSGRLDVAGRVLTLVLYYALVVSGFQLSRLFRLLRLDPALGHLAVLLLSSLVVGVVAVDQVAVYVDGVRIGSDGVWTAGGAAGEKGLNPDAVWLRIAEVLAAAAAFMAGLNACHMLYFQRVRRAAVRGDLDEFRGARGDITL